MSRKLKSGDPSQPRPSSSSGTRSALAGRDTRRTDARAADAAAGEAAAKATGSASKDAILIHGISQDGETMAVLRAREDRVEAGVLRAVKDGQPVTGEVLKLTPRPEFPLLCDVEVQVPAGAINATGGSDAPARAPRGRPAQVATDTYRENWDAIWRKPGKKPLAN